MEQNRLGPVLQLANAFRVNNLRAAELSAQDQQFPEASLQTILGHRDYPGLQLAQLLVN